MHNNTLYILRGVSGAGKTTLATVLANNLHHAKAVAADDYFIDLTTGEYDFDVNFLGLAHNWCRNRVRELMTKKYCNIVLHNTNTSEKELEPYLNLAEDFGYNVVSLVVENRHGNCSIHNIPDNTLQKQRRRLHNSINLL